MALQANLYSGWPRHYANMNKSEFSRMEKKIVFPKHNESEHSKVNFILLHLKTFDNEFTSPSA